MLHELFDKQPPVRKPSPISPQVEAGLVEDFGSFGWLRNDRDRAVMLEIRHANANITAFSYALLESATFNPSTGIELNFSGSTVLVVGSNLNTEVAPTARLFEGLIQHRVRWIQEADETPICESLETNVVIDEVKVNSSHGNAK